MQKIILASRSPRRKQLLELANISFEIKSFETDETYPEGLTPEQTAIYIARKKSMVFNKSTNENEEHLAQQTPILSADTIVVLQDEIIGKPVDRNDAFKMLKKLSGKKHLVITGVVIVHKNIEVSFAETTEVEFYQITNEQIDYYIDNFKPFDKAGAYAIQEWIGAVAIKCINGDFYNVMGLPISRVFNELKKLDI